MNLPVIANPANEVARSLTGRDYLSYSQITTFQACPLKWWFHYVANRPHEQVGASLLFGGAIHAAIESYYQALMAGENPPGINPLMVTFDESWKADALAPVRFGKDESLDSLNDLARRMLTVFVQSDAASMDGTIVGIEEEIRSSYIRGLPDLLARIDLIVLTDDAMIIRDFKTSRSAWGADKLAEASPQLLLYGDLAVPLAEEFGDRPVKMEFVVLTKAKTPVITAMPLAPNNHRLAQTRRIIERVWEAMKADHIYPNPSPLNCTGCPFQHACRQWCE